MRHLVNIDDGSAAAEFAVILPVLIIFIVGILDYAGAVNISTKLNSAARAGLQYAMSHPADNTGIVYAAQYATTDTSMTVSSPSHFCTCGSSTAPAIPCNSTCAGTTLRNYISLSTTQTYTPLISYSGLGNALTMTGSAVIQVQ